MLLSLLLFFEIVVYESSGNRELVGYRRHVLSVEPSGVAQFFCLHLYLTAYVVGCEAHHDAARIWPWLTGEIAYVGDGEPHFFPYFSLHAFFKSLSCLNESCYKSIHLASFEIEGMHQKDVVVFAYADDDGRTDLRPNLLSAISASFADCSVT